MTLNIGGTPNEFYISMHRPAEKPDTEYFDQIGGLGYEVRAMTYIPGQHKFQDGGILVLWSKPPRRRPWWRPEQIPWPAVSLIFVGELVLVVFALAVFFGVLR